MRPSHADADKLRRAAAICLRAKWRAALHSDTATSNLAELRSACDLAQQLPASLAGAGITVARCARHGAQSCRPEIRRSSPRHGTLST
jgi:hypothetical protein